MVLEQQKNPSFVAVKCKCGRALRAKWDQVGGEIRCWDCHEVVLVRMPHPRARIASQMYDRFKGAILGVGFNRLATFSLLVTAALTVPWAGVGVASLILIFLAAAYGEAIRRGDSALEDDELNWRTLARPRSVPEAIGAVLMVAGAVVPLWVVHAGVHRSPHLDRYTAAILVATWLALPALMVMAFAREPGELTGGKRVLAILRRHPWLLAMSLMIVPLGFLALEASLGLGFYLQGSLPFFTLEHMPIPGKPAFYIKVPHYESKDFRLLPQGQFYQAYFSGLRGGYSFLGAMPTSLSLPTRADLSSAILQLLPFAYAILRFMLAAFIVFWILAAYSIQARWLALLTVLEKSPRLDPAKLDEL